ncbi:MAG: hypothetical protein R2883_03685 [Caldisericia bacterium]
MGTKEAPIYVTSLHDDEVGGDTNLNEDYSLPKSGDRGQIIYDGSSGKCINPYCV